MNKVQQKKWISVLEMGRIYIKQCYLYVFCTQMKIKETFQRMQRQRIKCNRTQIMIFQPIFRKIYFLTVSWWLADVFTIKQRWLIYRRVFRF